jgi:hypothetical protein
MEQRINTGSWTSAGWQSTAACEKDDQTVFKTNNTYEVNEGPTKCSPSDPQVYDNGTWAFRDNETKLVLDGSDVSTIDALDENSLVVTTTEVISGTTYHFKVSLRH